MEVWGWIPQPPEASWGLREVLPTLSDFYNFSIKITHFKHIWVEVLFTWSKQKWLFWRAGFFLANQGFLKTFQIALIGWIKAGPPKKPLLFWSCKQATSGKYYWTHFGACNHRHRRRGRGVVAAPAWKLSGQLEYIRANLKMKNFFLFFF